MPGEALTVINWSRDPRHGRDPGQSRSWSQRAHQQRERTRHHRPQPDPDDASPDPLAENNKVPLISCAAGIEITEPVRPYVFKTAQNDVLAVAAIYGHMKKQNIKKVGI